MRTTCADGMPANVPIFSNDDCTKSTMFDQPMGALQILGLPRALKPTLKHDPDASLEITKKPFHWSPGAKMWKQCLMSSPYAKTTSFCRIQSWPQRGAHDIRSDGRTGRRRCTELLGMRFTMSRRVLLSCPLPEETHALWTPKRPFSTGFPRTVSVSDGTSRSIIPALTRFETIKSYSRSLSTKTGASAGGSRNSSSGILTSDGSKT